MILMVFIRGANVNINFELYKVFYYVAKNLSFSKASDKLYISQSAVSQSIRTLEDTMDTKLFIRNTKQVRLTQQGEILFKHIEQAFNFIKTGERSIQEVHLLKQGEVRIGASDTICKYYLLPYLKKFNQLYPHIKIQVTNRTSPKCIDLLKKGMVDIGVINIPEYYEFKNITLKKISTIQDVFIVGDNFCHLKDKEISLKELEKYPLLMLEKNTVTREFFDAVTEQHGIHITPEIELGSVELLIELAKIGLGISFVAKEYLANQLNKKEIFVLNIKENIPKRSLGIITHNKLPLPIAAQKFIELLC